MTNGTHSRTTVKEEAAIAQGAPRPVVSWGALLAGLALVIASAWIMLLLGAAIGFSIGDVTDPPAGGVAITSIIWAVLSMIVAFFLGALLAADLAGSEDHRVGLLHGVALWSLATVLALLMTSWGITNIVQTGKSLIVSASSGIGQMVGGGSGGSGDGQTRSGRIMAWAGETLAETQLADRIAATLKRQAGEYASGAGGEDVSQEEVTQAIEQLDADALKQIAMNLIAGNVEAAKDTLTVNTTLTEPEIEAVVQGVEQDVQQQIDEFEQQAADVLESANAYTQSVLWGMFFCYLLGLIAAIGGGWIGAGTTRRSAAVEARRETERSV